MPKYLTAALYKFVNLPEFKSMQAPIYNACISNNIKGTLLLAEEGINGTIAGIKQDVHNFLSFLRSDPIFNDCFTDLEHKESFANVHPFYRMKVKLKKEIVLQ